METIGEIPDEVEFALLRIYFKGTREIPPSISQWMDSNMARENYVEGRIEIDQGSSGARRTGPENRSLGGKNEFIRSGLMEL